MNWWAETLHWSTITTLTNSLLRSRSPLYKGEHTQPRCRCYVQRMTFSLFDFCCFYLFFSSRTLSVQLFTFCRCKVYIYQSIYPYTLWSWIQNTNYDCIFYTWRRATNKASTRKIVFGTFISCTGSYSKFYFSLHIKTHAGTTNFVAAQTEAQNDG
jgi:hypothetical protein